MLSIFYWKQVAKCYQFMFTFLKHIDGILVNSIYILNIFYMHANSIILPIYDEA